MTHFCLLRLGRTNQRCHKIYCDKDFKKCLYYIKNTKAKDKLFEEKGEYTTRTLDIKQHNDKDKRTN